MSKAATTPYASHWWHKMFSSVAVESVAMGNNLLLMLEEDDGVLRPLGAERYDSYDLALDKDVLGQISEGLNGLLKRCQDCYLYLPHIPQGSLLFSVFCQLPRRWHTMLWLASTMPCFRVPRSQESSSYVRTRLRALDRKRQRSCTEIIDASDKQPKEKALLFSALAQNSLHPEWHFPWLSDPVRLLSLLSDDDQVLVKTLVAADASGSVKALLIGFQIGVNLYVYKCVTAREGLAASSGLLLWQALGTSCISWGVSKVYMGIGLHRYKSYWSEWLVPQFNVLISDRYRQAACLPKAFSSVFALEMEQWYPIPGKG